MRIAFMGTPDFAVPSLRGLIRAGHDVAGVVTQPDRPRGRGGRLAPPPGKVAAKEFGIEVFQPEKIRQPGAIEVLERWNPDLCVVVAFGQILPKRVLDLPRLGCLNVHASLLPRYRGAAPIHWAIINGERVTGVTTMWMDEGLDTGDMILKEEVEIGAGDTVGVLHDRLAQVGARLLVGTLELIEEGRAPRTPQDGALATYAPLLKPEHEVIDWSWPAQKVVDRVRGMNPWPVAHTTFRGQRVKVWGARVAGAQESVKRPEGLGQGLEPSEVLGSVLGLIKGAGIAVSCGVGSVVLTEVQPQDGKRMTAESFAVGRGIGPGARFG